VLLRLEAGSTEAGFLSAFSDISSIPTFVVIENGQLQIQLKSDVNKNEFINSVRQVLGANPIPGSSTAQPPPPQTSTPEPVESRTNTEAEDDLYGPPEPSIPTRVAPAAASTLSANARGKQKAPESKPTSSIGYDSKAQQEARDALRKKKKAEADELARIKARIEADKAARRLHAEQRKAEREKEGNVEAQPAASSQSAPPSKGPRSQAKTVALNVRLFDGRTIRSTFAREASLQDQVRKWVDSEFSKLAQDDENINNKQLPPYYFKHIMAPQPSRELSAGDESQTLGDIDLAPSATLVLVPVKGYTDAYSGGASGGVVGTATGIVSGILGYVGSALGAVIAYGAAPIAEANAQEPLHGGQRMGQRSNGEPARDPVLDVAGQGVRVRTLADQRDREEQTFYNGNQVCYIRVTGTRGDCANVWLQLSTEPRPEDSEKRD
jgi:hypothetical protein